MLLVSGDVFDRMWVTRALERRALNLTVCETTSAA